MSDIREAFEALNKYRKAYDEMYQMLGIFLDADEGLEKPDIDEAWAAFNLAPGPVYWKAIEAALSANSGEAVPVPWPDHIADAGKVDDMGGWTGSITRSQAIKILDRATDKDDPHWEFVVEDFYDEASDTMPTIFHVFAAIGVTEEEYRKATGAENIDWPATDPSVPENDAGADAVIQFKDELLKSVKPIFQPHIEGVCAVVLERLRTAGDEGED